MANQCELLKSAIFAAVLAMQLSVPVSLAGEDTAKRDRKNKRTITTSITLFGNKTTTVSEDDRRVQIIEAADGTIKLEITERLHDKETTRSYSAASAKALKQQDAEAYAVYEEYSKTANSGLLFDLFSDSSKRVKSTMKATTGINAAKDRLKQARGLISEAARNIAGDSDPGEADITSVKRLGAILAQLKEIEDQLGKGQSSLTRSRAK
jgi:hypothetical protein